MKQVGLLGGSGRMGQRVNRLIASEFSKKASLHSSPLSEEALEPLLHSDVVIDFSAPSAMVALTHLATSAKDRLPAFVVGSTGWTGAEMKVIEDLARKTLVLVSSNFSVGALVLIDILEQNAQLLRSLGYEPVLTETHHIHKKDAPSGTAKAIQQAISPDRPSAVQTHSARAGEVVGDHQVTFYSAGDQLLFGHHAQDRSIFARGAIQAALWLADRRQREPNSCGLVTMEQFLTYLKGLVK